MSITAKALWYIESHASSEFDLDRIAEAAGVSRFHLIRAFRAATGQSPMAYVRARRLSQSAQALRSGAPDILAVALEAGYGSHEAFTRAFTQHFGLTPEQLRSQGTPLDLQEPLRMNTIPSTPLAAPRLVRREAFRIFGLTEGHPTNATMPAQWDRFLPWLRQPVAYGVIADADQGCDYTTGYEVAAFPSDPPGFTHLTLPARTYAVFHHRDHVSAIALTWRDIWDRALPEAGLTPADAPAFERYDERFDGQTGLGGFEIWIPLERSPTSAAKS